MGTEPKVKHQDSAIGVNQTTGMGTTHTRIVMVFVPEILTVTGQDRFVAVGCNDGKVLDRVVVVSGDNVYYWNVGG